MCDGLGIIQDDLFVPEGPRNRIYRTIFLRPCFIYGTQVLGVKGALSDTIEEALAGWSPKQCGAEFPTRCAQPSKEGPDCRASNGGIERIPLIGTNVDQNGVHDL